MVVLDFRFDCGECDDADMVIDQRHRTCVKKDVNAGTCPRSPRMRERDIVATRKRPTGSATRENERDALSDTTERCSRDEGDGVWMKARRKSAPECEPDGASAHRTEQCVGVSVERLLETTLRVRRCCCGQAHFSSCRDFRLVQPGGRGDVERAKDLVPTGSG